MLSHNFSHLRTKFRVVKVAAKILNNWLNSSMTLVNFSVSITTSCIIIGAYEPSSCELSKMQRCPCMPAVVLYYCTFYGAIL